MNCDVFLLIVAHVHVSQTYLAVEPEGSSPSSQKPTIGTYREPDEFVSPSFLRPVLIFFYLCIRLHPSGHSTKREFIFVVSPDVAYAPNFNPFRFNYLIYILGKEYKF
jgi:hypothetical protein